MDLHSVLDGDPDQEVGWAPQEGGQQVFSSCPVFEVLLEGNRGGGKTESLFMDFGQHVGEGFGAEWRGIIFRKTYPQLADLIEKTKKWFPRLWPDVKYNESKTTWRWPTGEWLKFSYMAKLSDFENYQGHQYPFIGWEELTNWGDPAIYRRMMSCCRSPIADIPRKYRATCNPYGPGHNWVKMRWQLPILPGERRSDVIKTEGEPDRCAVHIDLTENLILLNADPGYIDRIRAAARNQAEADAWIHGSWDIVAGGMFDDVWSGQHVIVPDFTLDLLPKRWRMDRAYDHGQSAPFAVGWYAESNGEPFTYDGKVYGQVRGDIFRIAEWYGWSGSPNEGVRMLSTEIARGIVDRETQWGIRGRVHPGPADSSIYDEFERGKSVAGDMARLGVQWMKADKGPGSRKQGWEQLRQRLRACVPAVDGFREEPGLFVCRRNTQFLRTFPVLPRCPKDMDDVDTESEDHIGDEVRYRVRRKENKMTARSF